MKLSERYQTPQKFIEDMKEQSVWKEILERLNSEAKTNPVALWKDVKEQFERHMSDCIVWDYWELTHHNVEKTVEEIFDEEWKSPGYLKAKVLYMLKMDWVEKNCYGVSKNRGVKLTIEEELEILKSEEAGKIWEKLRREGYVDAKNQPKGLTWAQMGYLADRMAEQLCIEDKWKVFGCYWNKDSGALKTAFNKGGSMRIMNDFIEKVNEIMR